MKRFAWVWTAVMVISLSVASGASTPGRPYSFGHNAYGKLGYGYADTNAHPTPAGVPNLSRIVGVSAGDHHSLAVKEDGTVWVWGCNGTGQCDGTFIDRWSPAWFYPLTGVVAVEAGMGYSMALKSDGTVWTWGTWDWGVLGQGNTCNIPGQVVGLEGVVGIAAGMVHNLAVKSDGTVWAWGKNTNGQLGDDTIEDRNAPVQVQGLTDAVSVSAGYMHSLALMRNGTVWAWGDNSHGELGNGTTLERHTPVQVAGLSDVESISAGVLFSLAVKSDGTVWAWGLGSSLGIGATDDCLTPVQITVLTGVSSISSGGYPHHFFCLALCKDGTVHTWGLNSRGQFGDGTTIGSDVPVKNNLLSDVVSVSAGFIHSLVVVEAKPVSVRFSISPTGGEDGRLLLPQPVVEVVDSGGDRVDTFDGTVSIAIKAGTGDPSAQLLGTTSLQAVDGVAVFTDLAIDLAGTGYVLTASSPGLLDGDTAPFDVVKTARCLAFDIQPGQGREGVVLGTQPVVSARFSDGTKAEYYTGQVTISIIPGSGTPGAVLNGNRTKNCINGRAAYRDLSIDKAGAGYVLTASNPGLASGDSQPFDVVTRYTVYAWGLNEYGQLGDGTVDERHTPTALAGLYDVISVDGGTTHSLTATEDGSVWGWGNNYYGQLGDGSTTDSLIPVQISGLAGVRQVSAGRGHSLALMENGTVWAWGWNSRGQLGDGTQTWRSTPVQVPDLTDIKAVSAGYYHSLALKNDGTVWAWGGNTSGQLGDGTWSMRKSPVRVLYLSDVKAVSAGSFHSLALKEDGSVWAWGLNSSGQLGINTTESSPDPVQVTALNEVAAVAAGGLHSLAVKSDGTVLAFGSDGLAPTEDLTPVAVAGLTGVISATAGESSSFVMCDDRSLWAWGSNYSGTLGDGTTEERHTPVRVLCPAGIIAIGAGDFHGMAVVSSVLTHPYAVEEARDALSITGGLSSVDRIQFDRLNAVFTGPSAGIIDIIDVARIARKAAGLEPNP